MDKRCYRKVNVLLRVVFPVFIMSLLGSGCASYTVQTQKVSQSYDLGNFHAAATQITQEADKRGNSKDAVVWRLEQGAVLRTAGRFAESNQAFDKAEVAINKYEEQAKIKVGREALASVTNPTTLPYEGFAYDKIMMNTYKALNYLQMGDSEKARVEFNRAYQRQDDAVQINSARIEKAQEEGNKQNLNVDLNRINSDQKFKSQFDNYYSDLGLFKAYAVYVNPLTVYLDGLYFMTNATGGSDLERALKSFERVLGMIGENQYIRHDMETMQQVVNGKPIPATTYVFIETGQAPEREQIRIDLPLFLVVPGVPYMGAAFPRLKYNGNYLSAFNISHDGKTEAAFLLSNMDAVIAQEFKNELPTIITKTIIASVIKAGITYGTYAGVTNSGRKNTGAGLAVLLAGAIYQAATNQADLRTWTTLPKEFHFCRFPTPADRKIELAALFSGYKLPVIINDGLINVVWVKSINRGSPLLVSQFKLKDETKGAAILPPPETAVPKEVPQQEPAKPEQPSQLQQSETSKPEQAVQPAQPETLEAEQSTQMPQQETSKPEEAIQGNKTETSTKQPVQPEIPKSEESTHSDNNQSSVPKEDIHQEPQKPEQQPEASKLEQVIQPSQPETSKSEQSTQKPETTIIITETRQETSEQPARSIQKNEAVTYKRQTHGNSKTQFSEEKIVSMETERIFALGKAKVKQIDPLQAKNLKAMDSKDWGSVILTGKKLLEIDPDNYFANICLGYSYAMLNEFELPFQYFTKANQLMPEATYSYVGMTLIYAKKGDKDRAMEFLQYAVDRGFDINMIKNDASFPEDFRNDPRLNNFIK